MNPPNKYVDVVESLTNPTRIPHRFSERSFRSYEPAIAVCVRNWPAATEFAPSNSLETFSQRFRDAIKSHNIYKWPTTTIDANKWADFHDNKVVRITAHGTILVHHRAQRGFTAKQVDVVQMPSSDTKVLRNPALDELLACLTLLSHRHITQIDVHAASEDVANYINTRLPNEHDVAVRAHSATDYVRFTPSNSD